MNAIVGSAKWVLPAVLLMAAMGCATVNKHTHAEEEQRAKVSAMKGWPLRQHYNPGIRITATVGGLAGGTVGLPISFGLLPITAPIAGALDSNLFPLGPLVICYMGGENVFGALAWPFFGWWHWPAEGGAWSAESD
jgi:hypothetical protein